MCYQVPALLLPGITLVVSPLVSLMRDQVTQLVQMGVPAAYLNSSLTYRQYLLALDRAREGRYKIIYVAPERLDTEGFQSFVRSAQISMVAVDEAHCISQWGQDFRPAYLNIPDFVDRLPQRPVVGAFTATATSEVREDIQRLLELEAPLSITTGFDRDNLYLEVCHPSVQAGGAAGPGAGAAGGVRHRLLLHPEERGGGLPVPPEPPASPPPATTPGWSRRSGSRIRRTSSSTGSR